MKTHTFLVALMLAALLLPLAASADEIWMTTGRKLEGTLTDLGNGKVRIEMSFGTLELPADQIARVVRGSTAAQEVERVLASLAPGDAEGRFELALWCRDNGEATLERRLLERVILIDPDHEGARHLLGYLRLDDGTWVTESQLRQLRGEVQFRGQWVPEQERSRILQTEQHQEALQRIQDREDARLQIEAMRLQLEASRLDGATQPTGVAGIPIGGFPLYGGSGPYGGDPYGGYYGLPQPWWQVQVGVDGSGVHASGSAGSGTQPPRQRSPRAQGPQSGNHGSGASTPQPRRHTRGGRVLYAPPPPAPPER